MELKGIRRLAFVLLAAPASSGAGAALAGPARAAAPSSCLPHESGNATGVDNEENRQAIWLCRGRARPGAWSRLDFQHYD